MTRAPMTCAALTIAMLCGGGAGASHAQLAPGMTPGTSATRMMTGTGMQAQSAMPAAVPRPGIVTLTPLGGIQLNIGSLSAPGQIGALGAITACPAAGIATSPASGASTAAFDAANGIIPSTPAGVAPTFGTLSLSSACNPIMPGSPANSTLPTDVNAAAAFVDGALPVTAVESGSPGMSPLIIVPPPAAAVAYATGMMPPTSAIVGNTTGSSSAGLATTDAGAMDVIGSTSASPGTGPVVSDPPPAIFQ